MKSFTDLFIKRPVLAVVVNLVILIAGFQAIRSLNVRQYPRSENATVTITTAYVGAPAELVRGFITQPLERVIAAADGIEYLQSASKLGLSTITARLKLNYDANKALSDIRKRTLQKLQLHYRLTLNRLIPEITDVTRISPAPRSTASRTHCTTSLPVRSRPLSRIVKRRP